MATTIQMHTVPPAVVIAQPPPPPPSNLAGTKGLAITQLVIGIVSLLFGIGSAAAVVGRSNVGSGLWAGGWIALTGFIGIFYSKNPNGGLGGVYMAFSIISTLTSGIAGIILIILVAWFSTISVCDSRWVNAWNLCWSSSDRAIGLGLTVPLLILMTAEFFVSIVASIFVCQNNCGRTNQTGVIIHQQQQPQVAVVHMTSGQANNQPPPYGTNMVPVHQKPPAGTYGGQMAPQVYPGSPMPPATTPHYMPQQTHVVQY